jgi:hypothetical protein
METSVITHPASEEASAPEGSQPVANYGLLADCNSAALVDRDGSIDWLCLPRYDSLLCSSQVAGLEAMGAAKHGGVGVDVRVPRVIAIRLDARLGRVDPAVSLGDLAAIERQS